MIRNLKALGLALVAVFAVGAVTASAASALVEDKFTTSVGGSALVTGVSHNNQFAITGGPIFECTTSKFTGTFVNGTKEVTVDPSYTGLLNATPHGTPCTSSLGNLTIDMNSCNYVLSGVTSQSDGGEDGPATIECSTTGDHIVVTAALGCKIKIPAQTPTEGGVHYTTLPAHTGGSAVEVKATATGITYTTENCIGLSAENNNAKYTGTVTVTGYEDTDGLPTPITEGKQVGISVS